MCESTQKFRDHNSDLWSRHDLVERGHPWSSCPGQRVKFSAKTWGFGQCKAQRGRGGLRVKEGHMATLALFTVRLIAGSSDDVGLLLVVCLQHVFGFDSSGGGYRYINIRLHLNSVIY